jgi:hypothetical protein
MRKEQKRIDQNIQNSIISNKISEEYYKLQVENEKKVFKIKQERQIQNELDKLFNPYLLPKVYKKKGTK